MTGLNDRKALGSELIRRCRDGFAKALRPATEHTAHRVCGMSGRGNCWDNAAMESFFSTMKAAQLSRKQYRNRDDPQADVFDYIERFYNPRRRHRTIGYIIPVQFENLQCLKNVTVILGKLIL
jgi:transposase InsO family protein